MPTDWCLKTTVLFIGTEVHEWIIFNFLIVINIILIFLVQERHFHLNNFHPEAKVPIAQKFRLFNNIKFEEIILLSFNNFNFTWSGKGNEHGLCLYFPEVSSIPLWWGHPERFQNTFLSYHLPASESRVTATFQRGIFFCVH